MAADQAPPSLGFSRQKYWNGLPFPSPMHACMQSCFSCVRLCVTLWTAAHQAPLSTGLSRKEYWSGLPFPSLLQKAQGPGVCNLPKPPASRALCQAKRAPRAAFPSGCLAAQTKRWAEGFRVPAPLAGGGSTTARGILRSCPESACMWAPSNMRAAAPKSRVGRWAEWRACPCLWPLAGHTASLSPNSLLSYEK